MWILWVGCWRGIDFSKALVEDERQISTTMMSHLSLAMQSHWLVHYNVWELAKKNVVWLWSPLISACTYDSEHGMFVLAMCYTMLNCPSIIDNWIDAQTKEMSPICLRLHGWHIMKESFLVYEVNLFSYVWSSVVHVRAQRFVCFRYLCTRGVPLLYIESCFLGIGNGEPRA